MEKSKNKKTTLTNRKSYNNDWPIVAICYDFDKTLSPKDMQEFGLIPKLGCSVKDFWDESNEMAQKEGMDTILAYMWLIINKAKNKLRISDKDFKQLGRDIELFPGVDSWFDRMNVFAKEIEVNLEHYIISAGLKEIIEGTTIAKYFTGIYASSFFYDTYGAPIWPRQVVNYTTKTQYLFRISKNCLDLGDEKKVNEYQKDEARRIPFNNFIYIGDSETDIPAMKIIKNGGGTSIGVYNYDTSNISHTAKLLKQDRIDFLVPALYQENGNLDNLVKDTLRKIKIQEILKRMHYKQTAYVDRILDLDRLMTFAEKLFNQAISKDDAKEIRQRINQILNDYKKQLISSFSSMVATEEIDKIITEKKESIKRLAAKKGF